jgi:hypothetical protein
MNLSVCEGPFFNGLPHGLNVTCETISLRRRKRRERRGGALLANRRSESKSEPESGSEPEPEQDDGFEGNESRDSGVGEEEDDDDDVGAVEKPRTRETYVGKKCHDVWLKGCSFRFEKAMPIVGFFFFFFFFFPVCIFVSLQCF